MSEQVEVEIEELISQALPGRFADEFPDAVEARTQQRGTVRYKWDGRYKEQMVEFFRRHATLSDVQRLLALIRRLRRAAGLSAQAAHD